MAPIQALAGPRYHLEEPTNPHFTHTHRQMTSLSLGRRTAFPKQSLKVGAVNSSSVCVKPRVGWRGDGWKEEQPGESGGAQQMDIQGVSYPSHLRLPNTPSSATFFTNRVYCLSFCTPTHFSSCPYRLPSCFFSAPSFTELLTPTIFS